MCGIVPLNKVARERFLGREFFSKDLKEVRGREPGVYLREEHSKQKEQPVQRS